MNTPRQPMTEVERVLLSLAQAIRDVAGPRALTPAGGTGEVAPQTDALTARIDALEATQAQLTRIIEQQNQIIAGLRPQPEPAYASNVKAIHKR